MATVTPSIETLEAAGLPRDEVREWIARRPGFATGAAPTGAGAARNGAAHPDVETFGRDREAASRFLVEGESLRARLPSKPRRTEREQAAATDGMALLRDVRLAFMRAHAPRVYAELTDGLRRFARAEELVYAAAECFPGLTPTRAQVQAERQFLQKDKDGVEMDQGFFLSQVLSLPLEGLHLVHAMLRPRQESLDRLPEFQRTGRLDLGTAWIEKDGPVGYLYPHNQRFINAEDDSTTDALEIGTDLILLDPTLEVGVMRGSPVDHPKYAGRRVFSAGINLTHIYHGQISFLFYITRDMGYVNKIYRGLSGPEFLPNELEDTIEKPWIAAVEAFAIGGGCQLLLVFDHVIAESNSYFSLPARKEGIIPGAANLRMPRFIGDRLTRQGILFDRTFPANTPEGQMLCDQVIVPSTMDETLQRTVDALTKSGVVSAAGNRKAIRIGEEPIDVFRQYMAVYAREQAYCHFSPQLIRNLEENWQAHRRKP